MDEAAEEGRNALEVAREDEREKGRDEGREEGHGEGLTEGAEEEREKGKAAAQAALEMLQTAEAGHAVALAGDDPNPETRNPNPGTLET